MIVVKEMEISYFKKELSAFLSSACVHFLPRPPPTGHFVVLITMTIIVIMMMMIMIIQIIVIMIMVTIMVTLPSTPGFWT